MVDFVWTEPALSDLDAIADYIALDKSDAASQLVQRVFAHVELLAAHPGLGPGVPELRPGSRYRQWVEPPCRVFYRYDKATRKVLVLGVMRAERRFQRRLLHRSTGTRA
jgi:toxin ParE1/3/4